MSTAVVFNDTRIHQHFGCDRVMAVLEAGLTSRGVQIIARSPVRHAWWDDAALMRKIAEARLLVINGEGTLHHGGAQGEALMRLARHPVRGTKPLFLINALYQENPPDWGEALKAFTGLWARESRSAAAMSLATGRKVGFFGDLTLCGESILGADGSRSGVIFGDSVKKKVSRRLAQLSSTQPGCRLIPIVAELKTVRDRTGVAAFARRVENRLVTAIDRWRYPALNLLPDQQAYAEALRRAALHVTGRFHGLCFSVATGTPFVTLSSNSWKSEALIADAGLSPERLVSLDRLGPDLLNRDWAYSAQERVSIRDFLAMSQAAAAMAFDEIAAAA